MGVTSPGVTDEDRVRGVRREFTPGLIGDRHIAQHRTGVEGEGAIISKGEELASAGIVAGLPSTARRQCFAHLYSLVLV